MSLSPPPRFHLWIPNLFEDKGGIQVYSAYLLAAIQQLYHQSQLDVFLKHDVPSATRPNWQHPHTQYHYAGAIPLSLRTPFFAAQLISRGYHQRPNLVIATHLNFTTAAYQLKRLTGVPYWAIAHGIDAWNITHSPLKMALRHADRILAVSHHTRDRLLQEQSLDPAKVGVLFNTFDADRFAITAKPIHLLKRHGLTVDQPIMLTVCRLERAERYKGYDQILAALPAIRQVIPTIHYIIVGKGNDRDRVSQLIAQHQLQDCVTLAGFIPDAELCDYYNLCDVFAMPSKLEGFGIVYLEALACGKPVVGGNQDGAVDALCGGKLGALVDPDNIPAIAQALMQILQGQYPNPFIYQPEWLRQQAIDRFGFINFQAQLSDQLAKFL
jgi:glycosyltransferase involved in cell wall biosynthesis